MSDTLLLWLPLLLPLLGAVSCIGLRQATAAVGLITAAATLVAVSGLCLSMQGTAIQWPPAGVGEAAVPGLRSDGLSALMLLMTATVGMAVSIYAAAYLDGTSGRRFWPLWLALWSALNALYMTTNLLVLYLALETVGLLAVALVAMARGPAVVHAALRYLFASAAGSLTMLMGAALLFAAHGSLDLQTIGGRATPGVLGAAGIALIVVGLLVKTALFPMHGWLPPFHARAPAPVSALHSALVVKASFYVLLRLWLVLIDELGTDGLALMLGLLGALAIGWGAINALCATRLKLVVAYSTVAQLGYLFVAFPLIRAGHDQAVGAVVLFAFAHALAKAAMFMAAGNLQHALGHDRLSLMRGVSGQLPSPVLAFALAGASIIGLPPSGGFAAKWLLLQAALADPATMAWAIVLLMGSLLSAAYVFRVLFYVFATQTELYVPQRLSPGMQWSPVLLAIAALLLGFVALAPLALVAAGGPL